MLNQAVNTITIVRKHSEATCLFYMKRKTKIESYAFYLLFMSSF